MSTVIAVTQRGGRFLAHLGEMCLAMCVGAVILNLMVFRGAALIGYPDLYQRFPELSTLWIALTLSVPMAAWMRFRGHDWRPTLEMSGATIVVWVLLIGIYWLGILRTGDQGSTCVGRQSDSNRRPAITNQAAS